MTLGFFALPANTQNIVFSYLAWKDQFCLWSTSNAIYAPKKLEFMRELFKKILGSKQWTPQRKYAAVYASKRRGDELENIRKGILIFYDGWDATAIISNQPVNTPYRRDEALVRQLLLAATDKNEFKFYDAKFYPKSWRETYLTLVAGEKLTPTTLHLELDIPWDKNTLEKITSAFKNRYIREVILVFQSWTSSQLTQIVTAIKDSSGIQSVTLVNSVPGLGVGDPNNTFSEDLIRQAVRVAAFKFKVEKGRFWSQAALELTRNTDETVDLVFTANLQAQALEALLF
jgi:hypothetical protein